MPLLEPLDAQALDLKISQLLAATASGYDRQLDGQISEILHLLREQLQMDVVFVSEFVDGQRVFRFVDGGGPLGIHAGDAGPLEQSYCQRVVDGRMSELVKDASDAVRRGELPATGIKVGGHLSTPVVLHDGRIYGTVCCFSTAPKNNLREGDLVRLKQCAILVARKLDIRRCADFAPTEPDGSNAEKD